MPSDRFDFMIWDPNDCGIAMIGILQEAPGGRTWEPFSWSSPQQWTYKSYSNALFPKSPDSRVMFTRLDIANAASILQAWRDNQRYGYRSGYMKVGFAGVFSVALFGVPQPPEKNKPSPADNINTIQPGNGTSNSVNADRMSKPTVANDTTNLSYNSTCFPPSPVGHPHHPIGQPPDCVRAIHQVMTMDDPQKAPRWALGVSWIYDTCVVTLHHNYHGWDYFSAYDMADQAYRVFHECVNLEHVFRGG